MQAFGAAKNWIAKPAVVEPLRLRRVPLLAAALCFALGDLLARRDQSPFLLVASTSLLFALSLWSIVRHKRIAIVPLLALWTALGCWCAHMQPPVPHQDALTTFADGLSRSVRGRVVRVQTLPALPTSKADPQTATNTWEFEAGEWEMPAGAPRQSVDLDVSAVEYLTPDISTMQPVSGGVRLQIYDGTLPLHCGDTLEIPLRLRIPEQYRDPGAWSGRDQLLGDGIGAIASVRSSRVQTLTSGASTLNCRFHAAQNWAADRLTSFVNSSANRTLPAALRLGTEDAAMLNAMLFGDRTQLTHTLREGFERTGTFHLFVVSGLHVVLLSEALFWLLRRIRLPVIPALIITLAATTAYALLTGFGRPVERALVMSAVVLIGSSLGRANSALNALGAAVLLILVADPRALFESGFQMTALVVIAIAGLMHPLDRGTLGPWRYVTQRLEVIPLDAWLHPSLAQFRIRLRMAESLCNDLLGHYTRHLPVWIVRAAFRIAQALLFGILVEICMMLPMAIYFHRAVLLALPVNLIAVPLISVLLCFSIATFCAALISPWLAVLPGSVTGLLLHILRTVVHAAQHVSLSDVRVPQPALAAVIASSFLIAFACWALRSTRKPWRLAGAAATLAIPLLILWPQPISFHRGDLEVTALDVGQGDSLLVISPNGHTLLVDAGGPVGFAARTRSTQWDVGEEIVAPFLWSRGVRRLDAVLLTHAHSDHMGGMPAILRDFRPRELWLSIQPGDAPGLIALLAEAQQLGITVHHFHAGDAFAWGNLQATVLAPELTYANPGQAHNNDSLVMRLDYARASVLLEGDAEAPSEAAMLANNRVHPATLLKVGHHGSKTSTTPAFLQAVAPQDAVISVGRSNTFGHPRREILGRLEAEGAHTYRTDRFGAETFLLTPEGRISAAPAASN
jgi:competence protein ComEC